MQRTKEISRAMERCRGETNQQSNGKIQRTSKVSRQKQRTSKVGKAADRCRGQAKLADM
jgi:hypothetical protein